MNAQEGAVGAMERIAKKIAPHSLSPNLKDYDKESRAFSWEGARGQLDGLPDGSLNIAYEAVDRHLLKGRADKVAIRWLSKSGSRKDITYGQLAEDTDRFARLLTNLGLNPGDRVFSMLGRVPELYIAALGTLKAGMVFSPLFSAFGPEPVKTRLIIGEAACLITSAPLYRRKIASIRNELPKLEHVLIIDPGEDELPEGLHGLPALLSQTEADFQTVATDPEDMALLHFTSGTTGTPKGAVHVHAAVIAHHVTGQYALDLHEDDIYWCTADPGWVTGMSYGIIAPLTNATTMIVNEAEFDVDQWYDVLEKERVSVWYTAPTAIRMLMKAGKERLEGRDLSHLRFMSSVGEPLNPEAVVWSDEAFGMPFHDNWWQTETGGIMIANYASMDVKPGSMGKPLPGIEAAIVDNRNGNVTVLEEPNEIGELALRTGWPSIMRAYLNNPEKFEKCFVGEWYLTGDLAVQDEDGYFWFVGRADDVIKSAGHLIGPFEVESSLIEHPGVAEAGVIGIPDERMGEVVKAYVTLNSGFQWSEELRKELIGFARKRLGPAVAPREIEVRNTLPKTRSGKIMRRLLKARELGLPEGDISTLESDES